MKDANHLDVFADDYMEDDITASFAAKVAVHAAYDASSDADMVIGDYDSDEEIEDPDEWDTAFLASLVYNGGIVDLDSVDDRRNKEFWNWYLTECSSTALDKDKMLTGGLFPNPAAFGRVRAKAAPRLSAWGGLLKHLPIA
ncbi:Imm5 family immunity protein [Bacteroides acidifaciens]|uniref:Imm5 family immunity protein n=1 Tax=Bacteroides acidifaciens TaxID=85831 RepID=UPI0025AA0A8B|nr:Imm5 family immunity protein [Bacteroides acidifaciens]